MWKFHAETVAMLTFSGFHDNRPKGSSQLPSRESRVPTEARRRVACETFILDKLLATFIGRPPLLSRRFCSIDLPLDLDDVTLFEEEDIFQQRSSRLGPGGWDPDGRLYHSSLLRARMMMALIRDEILEVVLSPEEQFSVAHVS